MNGPLKSTSFTAMPSTSYLRVGEDHLYEAVIARDFISELVQEDRKQLTGIRLLPRQHVAEDGASNLFIPSVFLEHHLLHHLLKHFLNIESSLACQIKKG
jgi:hypothetical protein